MKKFYEIIYAILSDTATPEEMNEFKILMESEQNQLLFKEIEKIWTESGKLKNYKNHNTEQAFFELTKRIELKRQIQKRYLKVSAMGMAASIVLLFGIFGLLGYLNFGKPEKVIVQTEAGNQSVIYLPDSSKVWLNAKTQISYDTDFGKKNRNIVLSGEASFDVKHSKKPFIVDVKDFNIKVFGTVFNVSAYPDDNKILTCLERGSIYISKPNSKGIFIEPGQLVSYYRNTSHFYTKMVETEKYFDWRINKMHLENESFSELAKKLERKYGVEIRFNPESLGEKVHYSGIFTDENIREILNAISIASGLNYTEQNNVFTIEMK